jgi:uncharacterized spore protein YtfJ
LQARAQALIRRCKKYDILYYPSEMSMAEEETVKATMDEFLKVLSAKNIMGEPVETEDKIIIPIAKMGMGFGTTVGSKEGDKTTPRGGAGGGAGVLPVAVVIVFKGIPGSEGVKVIPLAAQHTIAEPLAQIASHVLSSLSGHKEGEGKRSPMKAIKIE